LYGQRTLRDGTLLARVVAGLFPLHLSQGFGHGHVVELHRGEVRFEGISVRARAVWCGAGSAEFPASLLVGSTLGGRPDGRFSAGAAVYATTTSGTCWCLDVEHDRDRPVVDELERHTCPENAGLDRDAHFAERLAERLV
jgi:hypothetical protein